MGYYHSDWYHHDEQQDATHFFSFDDALKIGFNVDGPVLTVDAYTNFSDEDDIALEQQVARFLGGLADPNADPDRFDDIDGTDHFIIKVNTQTGVADLAFRDSSEYKFDRIDADPFPTQEFLGIISGGDPANPEFYGYDNSLKLAVGTDGSSLRVEAYTNYSGEALALEKEVLSFVAPLIGPDADPHRFDADDGTDHFIFTVDANGRADLTFEAVELSDFEGIDAEPFPVNEILALLTGDAPDGGYGGGTDVGEHNSHDWHHEARWDDVHHHSDDLVQCG
ncbi:hypothetical protein [Methylobacterium oxalidis]|uniref:Uncharacterized protein n=1 Tax=Methylobacterium oxalidis TaxID=944322 RepID=A0A512J886_9HYPH|nr:hypothetical protein [Methylobacterium oxalidis]GEP06174.1 hypothetical protein MOX02_42120 [Methylobacterium oxalidis]GJE34562.1 hypothetical protein LDDCCGHA_4774 [Methylobacterium oxalidis]GLS65193.1 hypothetical protein GCM10007888_35750 [Methylobacterium oxalidis]